MNGQPGKALLLTVGTGNIDEIENSLLRPIRLSMKRGEWARIVLLPSTVTQGRAEALSQSTQVPGVEIHPLPRAGLENDADACFRHFEAEIEQLRASGFGTADIVVDFTRGTKAMSAALVLAAVAHGIGRLRYIAGDRDSRGMVIGGREDLRETGTTTALTLRRIEEARRLVEGGAYAAALSLLPNPEHPFAAALRNIIPEEQLATMRAAAAFLAAWDRLDYAAAARKADAPGRLAPTSLSTDWRPLVPTAAWIEWVRRLNRQPDRTDRKGMARWLRLLMIDLLANAERRVRFEQFEDALVRAYRVLELVGQARLFDHDLDSEQLPEDHPAVIELRARLSKKNSQDFGRNPKGGLTAPRDLAARLLKQLGDPLGTRLQAIADGSAALQPRARNLSVLNHGYRAQAPANSQEWHVLFDRLWNLLAEDRADDPTGFEADRQLVRSIPSV